MRRSTTFSHGVADWDGASAGFSSNRGSPVESGWTSHCNGLLLRFQTLPE